MKYANSTAFRRALEDRLRGQSLKSRLPLLRLRKLVAFDRLLARLVSDPAESWILKGGLALQLRLGARSRTTQDMDLLWQASDTDIHQALMRATGLDLGDWFAYEITRPPVALAQTDGGVRFHVQAVLDGRPFERFHLDVGVNDPVLEAPEPLLLPPLLEFAELAPTWVACYPLTQHLAEKLHAYTRPRASGESTRVKDLVDILLMAELTSVSAVALRQALAATFTARRTHPLPSQLSDPPKAWATPFRRQADELQLAYSTLAEAMTAARQFIEPILQSGEVGRWDPRRWEWSK